MTDEARDTERMNALQQWYESVDLESGTITFRVPGLAQGRVAVGADLRRTIDGVPEIDVQPGPSGRVYRLMPPIYGRVYGEIGSFDSEQEAIRAPNPERVMRIGIVPGDELAVSELLQRAARRGV